MGAWRKVSRLPAASNQLFQESLVALLPRNAHVRSKLQTQLSMLWRSVSVLYRASTSHFFFLFFFARAFSSAAFFSSRISPSGAICDCSHFFSSSASSSSPELTPSDSSAPASVLARLGSAEEKTLGLEITGNKGKLRKSLRKAVSGAVALTAALSGPEAAEAAIECYRWYVLWSILPEY